MQTETLVVVSDSASQTERLAYSIGSRLRGGELIELTSDLGGGKTTFTRGLVSGASSTDVVSSPTFTVSKVYKAPNFDIHHFDFYRLPDAGLIAYEVEDLLDDPGAVLVVEWGGAVAHVLPANRVCIAIDRTGDESRKLSIACPAEFSYLLEGI